MTTNASAGTREGWFEWPLLEPAAGSALDASTLNSSPAGSLGPVRVEKGHFVDGKGRALRFWGCNLTSFDAFPPDANSAAALARQLAKGGINIARLHHLDNPWGKGKNGSIWPQGDRNESLDAAQLDKLHRLIAELEKNGIYINLNLKVSKTLTPEDGFPASISKVPDFQKRVDIFQRRMIDLQKDYARRILSAKNPYTGLSLAEDPGLAVVEINNENSLLGFWTQNLGRGLNSIAEPFRSELQALWNAWLKKKYANDSVLSPAWTSRAKTTESLINGRCNWSSEAKQGAQLKITPSSDSLSLKALVGKATGTDWHAQAHLGGLHLVDGETYSLEFEVRANKTRTIGVGVGLDVLAQPTDDWRSFGLLEQVDVTTEWKQVTKVFYAHSISGSPGRLSFNLAAGEGSIYIRKLSLREGCQGSGLQKDESLLKGNISIPTQASRAQWADWIAFLADTERAFAVEMRDFIRNELKVRAPMVCSQIDYGGLTGMLREQDMEFADSHVYWQHPDFASGGMWDKDAWTIRNSPLIGEMRDRSFGALGNMAMIRVEGKPFSIGEYDHPFPSDYVCEMYPLLSSFGCRQDWDALYPFCLGATGERDKDGAISDYFDQQHHPAKWGFSVFASRLFRLSLVRPAGLTLELKLGTPAWKDSHHAEVLWRKFIPQGPLGFLHAKFGVSPEPLPAGEQTQLRSRGEPDLSPISIQSRPHGQVWVISSPCASAAVGFIGGSEVKAGAMKVSTDSFGLNFAAVTAVSLDSKPLQESSRILVTLAARAENQGMGWNENRNSLGSRWGKGPPITERVPATITLETEIPCSVYALSPDGTRSQKVKSMREGGTLTFRVSPEDLTIHYEVVAD
jgi:hypothetical protein